MKIAKVYLTGITAKIEGDSPIQAQSGPFLDKRFANEETPFFLVEIPLRKGVMPTIVAWSVPGGRYYSPSIVDLSELEDSAEKSEERGWEDHDGEPFPAGGEWLRNPPKHYVALLREAQCYWRPLTSKPYASKLLKFLNELPTSEREDMIRSLGVRMNKRFREKVFICLRWDVWARNECTPAEREEDALKHGFKMNDAAIIKLATRGLGLDRIRKLRE